ncbi:hypothetical protein WJX79_005229 [Trebouxia sp. C0005]
MLGCFVMGYLSTGAVLGLKSKKSLAILPASHHFQDEKELQVANMIACCIDFIIGGLTNRYSLGYWPMVILPAIRVGYAGSLSTVSTFIAEVRAQLQGWPEKVHGYWYPFITIATGNVLGIALYGWSVWRSL